MESIKDWIFLLNFLNTSSLIFKHPPPPPTIGYFFFREMSAEGDYTVNTCRDDFMDSLPALFYVFCVVFEETNVFTCEIIPACLFSTLTYETFSAGKTHLSI